jgi:hypothetical protein
MKQYVLLSVDWDSKNIDVLTIEDSESGMKKAVKLLNKGGFTSSNDLKVVTYESE